MGKRDIEAGRAFIRLFLKNDMKKQLVGAMRGMQKSLKSVGKSMANVGGKMLKIGGAATLGLAGAVKIAADFDDQMRKVQAITGATGDQFGALREQAKKLGRETAFTAGQAAEAMTFLGMAGFDTEQILAGIPGVLSLASAGALELGEAADIASNIAGGFGMAAGEIGHVADVLAQAASSSNTSVQELGEAFSKAAPAARAAGQTLEEAAAAIGIMGDSGVKSSVAGIDLKNMLTKMAKSTEIMGVKTQDASGQMRDILDVMKELGQATAGMSEAERLSKFIEAFGERSAKSALILSAAGDRIDQLREKMAAADGRAKAMADTMEGGIGGAFRRVMSAAEGVAIEFGEALMPAITALADTLSSTLTKTAEFIKANKGLAMAVAAGVIAFTAAGAALVALGTGAIVASAVLGGLATIVGALASPVGLVAAALTAGVVLWAKYTESGQRAMGVLQRVFGDIWQTARKTFGGIADALSSGNLQLAGEIAFTGLQLAALQALGAIRDLFGDTVANLVGQLASGDLQGAWETTVASLGATWDALMAGLTGAMAEAVAGIKEMWAAAVKSIASTMTQNPAMAKLLGIDKERERFDDLETQQNATLRRLAEKGQLSAADQKIFNETGRLPGQGKRHTFDEGLTESIDNNVDVMARPLEGVAKHLEAASKAAQDRAESHTKLNEMNEKTRGAFDDAAEKLRKRLESLTEKASSKGGSADGGEAGGGSVVHGPSGLDGTATGLRGVQGGVPVTFNAAAAIAAGFQGASPEDKMVDHLSGIKKLTEDVVDAAKRTYSAVEKLASSFVYGS